MKLAKHDIRRGLYVIQIAGQPVSDDAIKEFDVKPHELIEVKESAPKEASK